MFLLSIHGVHMDHDWEVHEYGGFNQPGPAERAICLQRPDGGSLAGVGEVEEGADEKPVVAVGVPHLDDDSRVLLRLNHKNNRQFTTMFSGRMLLGLPQPYICRNRQLFLHKN